MMGRRRDSSSSIVLAAVVGLVAAGLVLDATLTPGREAAPSETRATLLAGSSTCAAVVLGEASQVMATTIAAPVPSAAAPTASLRLESGGTASPLDAPDVTGGALTTSVTGPDADASVAARWEDAPLLLSRQWSIGSTDRVPGTVEGPCPGEPSTDWVVPGVATAGGAAAQLHLANPTDGPASLAVTFTTPDGPVSPTRLANLAVPAHDRVTIDLNEFVPEEPDLGVVVRTRSGRVVAEVLQTLEAAVGGVDGRSLVVAEPEPREIWTIPWVAARDGETAWVWVTNPGEEATDVRLVVHTEAGPVVPPDSGVTLAPGTTQRIDLRGALGEVGAAAVTVRSAPGAPVVASGGVLRVVEDDPVRGGVAIVEGLPASSGLHAALSAVGASGGQRVLALANPGDAPATLEVTVVGSTASTVASVATGLTVPAGASLRLPLGEFLPAEGGFAALVDVTEGQVAAAMVSESAEGPLNLTAAAARAFPSSVVVTEREVRRDRALLHPIERDELDAPSGEGPQAATEPEP